MASAVVGGGRPVAAGAAGCSRGLERLQDVLPVLPSRTDGSFRAQREIWNFWVQRMKPEVGEDVCCSSGWMEPSGRLPEVRGAMLDDWIVVLESVE